MPKVWSAAFPRDVPAAMHRPHSALGPKHLFIGGKEDQPPSAAMSKRLACPIAAKICWSCRINVSGQAISVAAACRKDKPSPVRSQVQQKLLQPVLPLNCPSCCKCSIACQLRVTSRPMTPVMRHMCRDPADLTLGADRRTQGQGKIDRGSNGEENGTCAPSMTRMFVMMVCSPVSRMQPFTPFPTGHSRKGAAVRCDLSSEPGSPDRAAAIGWRHDVWLRQ